ncbi:hypothetical protein L208DRAFT_1457060 [Tricholoma matsutake]|nr:hypothetical protein L208DRAFT_1457060 [Tricholoma matsutake 945]
MAWFNYQYNLSRPYPGRYTTLIVTPLALTICILLVLINVPLSAYETRQEFTYTPNSTTNTLPFSNLIPAPLQKHSVPFIPHTFMMGENFQTDLGSFGYSMESAYTRNDMPGSSIPLATNKLPSFAYMNYDLSSCDVMYITLTANIDLLTVTPSALISCWFPLFFQFSLSNSMKLESLYNPGRDLAVNRVVTGTSYDFGMMLNDMTAQHYSPNWTLSGFDITYYPCCTTCNDVDGNKLEAHEIEASDRSRLIYDHPACDDQDVNFKLKSGARLLFQGQQRSGISYGTTINDFFSGTFANVPDEFPALNYNVLKAVYHGIRLDIGVIRPNQIYNSPTRFNASISKLVYSDALANVLRTQRDAVGNVNLSRPPYNQRVPEVLYLQSVFTPKPLGQAITAVFVATVSMITVLWHVANFIASSLVTARSRQATFCPCPSCQGRDIALHHVPMRDDPEWAASNSDVGSGTAYELLESSLDSSKNK